MHVPVRISNIGLAGEPVFFHRAHDKTITGLRVHRFFMRKTGVGILEKVQFKCAGINSGN